MLSVFTALVCALTGGLVAAPAPAAAVRPRTQATPSFNGTVWAIAFRGDVVYVGGSFTAVTFRGRSFPRRRLAALDARTGAVLRWQPAADGTVRALAVAGSAVYAAGDFDTISGQRRGAIARIDASSGRPAGFAHRIAGRATTLAIGNGRVYVGGRFATVDGTARRNLAAFSHTTGALDRSWRPSAGGQVNALAATRGRVYLGGEFRRVNGARSADRLAAVGASTGALVRGFRAQAPATVLDVAVDARGVYTATGGMGGRAVGYTASGAVRWTHLFDGDVHTIAVMGGIAYVGGHFDRACRRTSTVRQLGCPAGYASRVKLAALDGRGRLTGWNPRANGTVGTHVLTTHPARHRIAAGGAFTRIGGAGRERFALFG
ncbi:PQQ-binding-like beta-propeller repeat protein [Actinoplanes nipponensis]|nr:PQQ-binding-like beta-propeller repeat protein [Actinoplanes nipponensis]